MGNEIEMYGKRPLTAAQIKAQVQLIQEVMEAVMIEGKHYGKIPGTPKPTLYKPGAEKLLSTFHIGADPSEFITELSTEDEIRYRIAVKGFSQATGNLLGVGIGECSSNEDKYKWRKPVCEPEFEETPADRKRIVWKHGEKAPYQVKQLRMNPSDIANTILKMAKKRALVDMTLTITAASDIFDQDLEDLPEGMEVGANGKQPIKEPQKKQSEKEPQNPICSIVVKEVIKQTKNKDGEVMKSPRFRIVSEDGGEFITFSQTLAKTASDIKGTPAILNIEYTVGKYGNDVVNLKVVEPEEAQEDGNAQD
jgi:hypothetical protein